jgi:hypothetical protein
MIKVVGIKIERVPAHIIDFADHGTIPQTELPEVVHNFCDVVQSGLELADGV